MRQYLLGRCECQFGDRVLEVGSGTGAVLNALSDELPASVFGIDLSLSYLAHQSNQTDKLACADGHRLPFDAHVFAVTVCHYLLLWVTDPLQVTREMARVTRQGGAVIALAEPDHSARIDYPPPLDRLGELQTAALSRQGANVLIGRQLSSLFHQAGLKEVETGILGARWEHNDQEDPTEWRMLRADLNDVLDQDTLQKWEDLDQESRKQGERVLFVPTFFAAGIVP